MADTFCRVITVLFFCVIALYLLGYARKSFQEFRLRKEDKKLVKDFALKFLASHPDERGVTRYLMERYLMGVKRNGGVIFGCFYLLAEILKQLEKKGVITIRSISIDEVLQLEEYWKANYGENARSVVESSEFVDRILGDRDCLIQLTQKGRSFVNAYQAK